jgi:hypothetical protein
VLLDIWVGESDGSSIMSDNEGNLVGSHGLLLDSAELETSLFLFNPVGLESTLHIIKDTEELSSLLNCNHVHHAKWESRFSPDFIVNLDQSFLVLNNLDNLLSAESVFQSVLEQHIKRDAFSGFVGSSSWLGGVFTTQFVQHPMIRSRQSLHVLLWSSSLINS